MSNSLSSLSSSPSISPLMSFIFFGSYSISPCFPFRIFFFVSFHFFFFSPCSFLFLSFCGSPLYPVYLFFFSFFFSSFLFTFPRRLSWFLLLFSCFLFYRSCRFIRASSSSLCSLFFFSPLHFFVSWPFFPLSHIPFNFLLFVIFSFTLFPVYLFFFFLFFSL